MPVEEAVVDEAVLAKMSWVTAGAEAGADNDDDEAESRSEIKVKSGVVYQNAFSRIFNLTHCFGMLTYSMQITMKISYEFEDVSEIFIKSSVRFMWLLWLCRIASTSWPIRSECAYSIYRIKPTEPGSAGALSASFGAYYISIY